MKPSISAVVLTKNEEINLPRCLKYLSWVDDLIVVDTGSTDRTVELAKKLGARVFVEIPSKFYIADMRNWALDNTGIKTDWVLFVDADEVITEKLQKEILKAIEQAPPEVSAFQLCFKFMFLGRWLKHTTGFPSWHDRLLRFGQARFKGRVWETFDTAGRIERIHEPYLHYGFNRGINGWIDNHQRYADWKAEEMIQVEEKNISSFEMLKDLICESANRKRTLEKLGTRFGILSPCLRFFYYYFLKKGFLDGFPGLLYSLMMAYYQFMIYLLFLEKKRKKKGLRL
jgi:glycosyltransferase involved in cell wall biosynthesis